MAPFRAFSVPSGCPARCWPNWYLSHMVFQIYAFWVACWHVIGSAKLLAQFALEPHGPIACFLGALRVPCRRGIQKALRKHGMGPYGSSTDCANNFVLPKKRWQATQKAQTRAMWLRYELRQQICTARNTATPSRRHRETSEWGHVAQVPIAPKTLYCQDSPAGHLESTDYSHVAQVQIAPRILYCHRHADRASRRPRESTE